MVKKSVKKHNLIYIQLNDILVTDKNAVPIFFLEFVNILA